MRKSLGVGGAVLAVGLMASACSSSSGNGVASKSASEILSTTLAALKSASSVRVSGQVTNKGSSNTIDAVLYSSGDISGTVGTAGSEVKIVKIGETDYLQAGAAYWEKNGLPAADAAKLDNKWVSISDSTAKLGSDFSLGSLAGSLGKDAGTITKGSTSTVNGQGAIAITSTKGGTLYVATSGTAYPIKATSTGGANGVGSFSFSDWNQGGKAPTAPAGAEPLSSLIPGA